VLTSDDYKELAARCIEIANASSEPTVAAALRALALDYLALAARLHRRETAAADKAITDFSGPEKFS
jgi:hypothetical protein